MPTRAGGRTSLGSLLLLVRLQWPGRGAGGWSSCSRLCMLAWGEPLCFRTGCIVGGGGEGEG